MPARKKIPLHLQMMRGGIGKQFVIKHYGKRIVMTKFPDMSNIVASTQQRKCRNLFTEAVVYAKSVIADPLLKKEWQRRIRRRNGVYNKAIKAFMLKEKCACERARLLDMQRLRLAFKNAAIEKSGNEISYESTDLQKGAGAGYTYLETG